MGPASLASLRFASCLTLFAVLAVGGRDARGEPDTGTPPSAEPAKPAPASSKSPGALDFDLFGDQQKATPPGAQLTQQPAESAALERSVKKRRLMLQLHQGFGFATLALTAATVIIGQLNYVDKYGGGDFTEKYQTPHLSLAMISTAAFATTGLLALFAPTPYKKPIKADAALVHKVMMGIATAGMVTQIALGFTTNTKGGELIQRNLATAHLVTGYVTFASMAAGYLAWVF